MAADTPTLDAEVKGRAERELNLLRDVQGRLDAGGLRVPQDIVVAVLALAEYAQAADLTLVSPGIREALLAPVLALHRPWYETPVMGRADHLVIAPSDELPADHVCRIGAGFDVCAPGADEHYVLACIECRYASDDGVAYPFWPCPTARLADAVGVSADV